MTKSINTLPSFFQKEMSSKLLTFLSFFCFGVNFVNAQLNASLIGDSVDQGGNCFIITQDSEFQSGGVWYDNPINFDSDFTIYYQNDFGSKDADGADGMALVFKRDPDVELGNSGGGIGYEGITESLIIEFDTFENNSSNFGFLGDPTFDHIAIQRDGNPFHNNTFFNLAGPVQASSTSQNIEDGNTHEVKIEWISATTTLNVYFDCELRITLTQDIKSTVFSNDDSVFFGFVGSTGEFTNLHQVCFNSISFVDNLLLQDETICENDDIQVDATIPSGVTYSWSPTNGVSNPNISNPTFSPNSTTTYTVTIGDVCGDTSIDDFVLTVLPNVTPTFNVVSSICEGDALTSLPTTSLEGISGTWSPALNNSVTTTYTFTPNPGSCANATTLDVVVTPLITPTFNPIDPICAGDALSPLPTMSNNGITGEWSPALNNTVTTIYTFTPDFGQGCVDTTTLNIDVTPPITPSFDVVNPICEGDALAPLPTTSNNGISGTWSPVLNNTLTTTYTFTPNIGSCANATTLDIVVTPLTEPIFNPIAPICTGDTLAPLPTTSNNGITGVWSPALNNTVTTIYTFTPDFGQGCADNTTLQITVTPPITPSFDVVNSICEGDALEPLPTTSNNGISGTWSPALNNTATTVYTFTPDSGECAINIDLTITIIPNIIPEFDEVNPICPGEFLQELPLISNNGITGTWFPALNNQNTTEYTFTPDVGHGCVENSSLTIEILQPVIPTFSLPRFICQGESAIILPMISDEDITGNWSQPINNQTTTTYIFTPDPNQCASSVEQEIEVLPINQLELSVELISEPFSNNQTVVANTAGGNGMYEYQLGDGPWTIQNVFTNIVGCDEYVIRVRQINGCSINDAEVFRVLDYPKFFTPNGDGFNDQWNIECLIDQPFTQIYIFDRYGKLINTISPSGSGWNGTYNGALMPTNDYWFRVDYLGNDSSPKTFTSHFTLKR